jgi:hypothetical protein
VSVKITQELILQIRDDAELTAMARIIEGTQREARWQGFGSDWDMARFSAYMLRAGGFGRVRNSGIAKSELLDRILDDAKKHDAFKVLVSSAGLTYRIADPVRGVGPDGVIRVQPSVEIHEGDLEQILANSWVRGAVEDSYEYEGGLLKVLAGRYADGIHINIATAANFNEYQGQMQGAATTIPDGADR